jgi:hypothetical protein
MAHTLAMTFQRPHAMRKLDAIPFEADDYF